MSESAEYGLPFHPKLQDAVRAMHSDGLKPRTIARVLQLAELTGQDPLAIVARYKLLRKEVDSTIYGRQA